MKVDEHAFETQVAQSLVGHGSYTGVKTGGADFDATAGLDTVELLVFIESTQPDEWAKVVKTAHGDETKAQAAFIERLAKEIDSRGTLDVLRHGVVYAGHEKAEFRLAYFRPASGLNPESEARYQANRLTVTRQVPYETGSTKTLDLALFVNGIPVATAELKNPLTGQSVDHAREQYRTDRDPKNLTLSRRALVHFAVDTEQVFMTTRLAGKATRFLPFNRGDGVGAGNPSVEGKHRTSYLWERVWAKDHWMDILGRFIHAEADEDTKGHSIIFPRFHQWDAVLSLETAAREQGAGHSYLIQHSAGSGKSNTIAWLTYRLSSLHDAQDNKVFDKVVVVTDRIVLDKQLQETIYQFEHTRGVVQKIDENSAQLAEALAGEQARIIITTIFKFPFVMEKVAELPNRRYAVVIDEAHSSQTGEAAKEMKKVLGAGPGSPEAQLAEAEAAEGGLIEELPDPVEDALAAEVGARGHQENMSFFAFTATPKGRTLELFGRVNPETGKHQAFHLYSMRQAIEEGFIHDVLENYVTYATYYNIEKAVADDPEYDPKKARAAIARFVSLSEHNLAQRAAIIIDHFRTHVAHRIDGQAKAMVVTASRLHALRYKRALDAYCNEHGIGDVGVLVAFSGKLRDGDDEVTESKVNGFGESQTPKRFDGPDFQILVVAEKYQTGFDQPKLYAMYVDKTLTGLAAVQTLSRLNRTHAKKQGTFVLDFRNTVEDIQDSFAPWYTRTEAPPTDPHLLYDTRHQLDAHDLMRTEEVDAFVAVLFADGNNHGRIHGALGPAIDRFGALDEDDQDEVRDRLTRFIRTYSFLSQLISFGDTKLERDYLFGRALMPFIRGDGGRGVDLGSEIELTHLAMEKTYEGSAALDPDVEGEIQTVFSGAGPMAQVAEEPLSEIIAEMNERYGTAFTEEQKVHLRSIVDAVVRDEDVQRAAWANDEKSFGEVYPAIFENAMLDLTGANQDFTYKLLDNADLFQQLISATLTGAYGAARVAMQEHIPIGELLSAGETSSIEYKSTFRTHADSGEEFKPLETASLKTIAAFLNSEHGGTLLIGVADDGSVHGLRGDYASLAKEGRDARDLFELHITQAMINAFGEAATAKVKTQIHSVDGEDLCRVHAHPSPFPVDAKVVEVDKGGQHIKKTKFYVRLNNATRAVDDEEKDKYIAGRWG